MDLVQHLHRLGGIADRATLVRLTSRAAVDRALRVGEVVRDGRGRYALPTAREAMRAANALTGVVSHQSAAAYWGWEMKHPPAVPWVTVPRKRNVGIDRREAVRVCWATLRADEVRNGRVTAPGRTLLDCARTLPFDEALAITDSALRNGDISRARLAQLAERSRGPGSGRLRRLAAAADGRAANPFESVLRAIGLGVTGLQLTPQLLIEDDDAWARPDLVDPRRRLALEADSFEWHGSRKALMRDCRRYNWLVLRGWRVLRFSWEDVMLHPEHVEDVLRTAVGDVAERAQLPGPSRIPA